MAPYNRIGFMTLQVVMGFVFGLVGAIVFALLISLYLL